ncbi:MAG: arylesterase [Acidobacteria bacterium]|nr:arylesterase [Acidobacteriota bacterium]
MRRRWFWMTIFAAVCLVGCDKTEERRVTPAPPARTETAAPAAADTRPVIVAFGDSLTAGHGLEPGLSYPDFLQKDLDARGLRYRVVNQGISGDTTDGGVARMDAAIALRPEVVILELGANDGLRGLPVEATRRNLVEMVDAFQKSGAKVLLCGMTLPRNYGGDYIRSFEGIFADLSREKKLALVPFCLDGVATRKELMQADGLHPTAEGCKRVAANVMKHLEPMLR